MMDYRLKMVFTESTVIDMMIATGVEPAGLTGFNRRHYKGRTLDFDTFDSHADPVKYFAEAMKTELEHGTAGTASGTNVTGDDALATAKIAAAHLKGVEYGKDPSEFKPFPDYYDWLWWMEKLHEKALERP